MRRAISFGAIALLVPALTAQLAQTASLTDFMHADAAPHWTDDVPNADSRHSIGDQLNGIDNLHCVGRTMMLQPGTHVISARLTQ
jgi:hypothetical protein